MASYGFDFAIGGIDQLDSRYGSFYLKEVIVSGEQTFENDLATDYCSNSADYFNFTDEDMMADAGVQDMICVPDKTNMKIWGDKNSEEFIYIELGITICNHEDPYLDCATEDQ